MPRVYLFRDRGRLGRHRRRQLTTLVDGTSCDVPKFFGREHCHTFRPGRGSGSGGSLYVKGVGGEGEVEGDEVWVLSPLTGVFK